MMSKWAARCLGSETAIERDVSPLAPGSAAMLIALSSAAAAQDYPNRTIRIISPVPAGGLSDVAMRPMALELQKRLGQPVVIENRAGANGMLAGRACAQAAPDGYTICNLFNDTVLNAPFLFKNVGYDPRKDFTTITNGYFITGGFLVAPSVQRQHAAGADCAVEEHAGRAQSRRARRPPPRCSSAASTSRPARTSSIIPYKSGNEVANALLTNSVQVANNRRRQSHSADPGRQVQGDRGRFAGAPAAAAGHSDTRRSSSSSTPASRRGTVSWRPRAFRPRSSRGCTTRSSRSTASRQCASAR